MIIKKSHINDRTSLSCIKTDKFKTGILTFTLTVPFEQEGYIHSLLLAGVLRRGTEKFQTMAKINSRLDELYASCIEIRSNIVKDRLLLVFTAEFIDDRYTLSDVDVLDGIVEIVSEMLLHPKVDNGGFNVKIFEQELGFVVDSLNAERNHTRSYTATRCNEIINRENPFYPTIDGLLAQSKSITPNSLLEYYRNVLKNSPVDVFYVGNCDLQVVESKIKKYFYDFSWESDKTVSCAKFNYPTTFVGQKEVLAVSQGKLAMGFNTNTDILSSEYYAAMVFNELLGGSSSSKLFVNVRERLNICYYCSSSYSIYTGILLVSCGIDVKNYEIAKKEILAQLSDICDGNFDDYELRTAKKSLINCYKQIVDNPLDMQSFYSGRAVVGVNESIEECLDSISAVTKEQIISIARKTMCIAEYFVEGNGAYDTDIDSEEYDEQ